MLDPIFWLGLSLLLVAVSLTALLIAALPAILALGRAARSVEKLADTLSREFPPTLEAIRLTGMEISDLTDDVAEGVQSANQVVKQVDRSISSAKKQAKQLKIGTGSIVAGIRVGWGTFTGKGRPSHKTSLPPERSSQRLPSDRDRLQLGGNPPSYEDYDSETRQPYD